MEECEQILRACGTTVANLCGRSELLDIIANVEGARCVVSNNTGTAHLASAAARPMVVVCGPTEPRRVKPVGDNSATLQALIYCVNSYRKTCSHYSCMTLITPEMVIMRLGQLGARPPDTPSTA
ncbi:MAG: glycosyltransferase family 9 protein [Acidiferrobacterales bacterium]